MRQQQQPEPILIQLEVLAAAFPWDTVQLAVDREPDGEITYRVWINPNEKLGFTSYVHAWAPTAEEAVAKAIAEYAAQRNPETSREKAIAELREKIRKLEAITISAPPYIPNRELAQFVSKPTTIEV